VRILAPLSVLLVAALGCSGTVAVVSGAHGTGSGGSGVNRARDAGIGGTSSDGAGSGGTGSGGVAANGGSATTGGGAVDGGTDGPCQPKTCAELGYDCGDGDDGCGHLLRCGECPAGGSCSWTIAGSGPNQCGTCIEVCKTCAQLGANCGVAGDGVGGIIDCGACPSGEICGGGGMPGVCGPPIVNDGGACGSMTCTARGFDCGLTIDGCGVVQDCGVCAAGQTCGGGGKPNICG
jgi:hypothetical protein